MNPPAKAPIAPAPSRPAAVPMRQRMANTEPLWMALFDPALFATMKQMASIMLKSGFLPKALRTEEQVITILIKGRELELPPMESLSSIQVIDGKPAVSPQLMLALINRSGEAQDIVIEGDATKCTVTMTRRGRKPHTQTFTMDMARKMMTRDRETGRSIPLTEKYNWRQMPEVMLQWRAVSACARVVFPDVISGLYTPDEMDVDVTDVDDGAMHVADVESDRPSMPHREVARIGAPAGMNTETGEVPSAAVTAPEPAQPVRTEAISVAPAVPAVVDRGLADLIARAAVVQGYQGPDPVGHWLSLNYLTSKMEELTEAERADAHARAQSVLDTQAVPATTSAMELAAPATAPEPTTPMPTEPASSTTTDEEPPLTPEEATALRGLFSQAAAAEGLTGKGATLKWVDTHFGISGKKLEDVPGSVRTQMRETAIKILEQHEAATRDKTSTTTAPAAAAPATPALPDSPHTQGATPEQLDAIRQECATRGIVNPATEPIITWAVKTKFEALEDLTAAQADRVLRALRYNTRGQRSTTPA